MCKTRAGPPALDPAGLGGHNTRNLAQTSLRT